MPQMFPLMWLLIFISILSTLIMMSSSIHFSSSLNKISTNNLKTLSNQFPWKW